MTFLEMGCDLSDKSRIPQYYIELTNTANHKYKVISKYGPWTFGYLSAKNILGNFELFLYMS